MTRKIRDPYEEWGSRLNYLANLADVYDVPLEVVCILADTLGANEDFDGLINALEDLENDWN